MWMGDMAAGFSRLEKKVDALIAGRVTEGNAVGEEIRLQELPVSTDEDFIKLCRKISEHPSYESKLVSEFDDNFGAAIMIQTILDFLRMKE